jgi:putative endopeptidase
LLSTSLSRQYPGENIVALGRLKIAFLAFQKSMEGKPRPANVDGYTPEQRFFIAFAEAWRRNTRPEAVRLMLATDPHSPPRFRVMGPVSNMPEFFSAFQCKPGDQMVRAAGTQAKIW